MYPTAFSGLRAMGALCACLAEMQQIGGLSNFPLDGLRLRGGSGFSGSPSLQMFQKYLPPFDSVYLLTNLRKSDFIEKGSCGKIQVYIPMMGVMVLEIRWYTTGGNMDNKSRCTWLDGSEIYTAYHDNEWGKPVHDDNKLFELLTLESFQAGLMWITILKKREDFRVAFDWFDPQKVADYDEQKIEELVLNEKIIRHRGKIAAAINNAKLFIEIQKKYGSFDQFIWNYVDNKPIVGHYSALDELPATTKISDKLSKDLKKMGFKFLGSTTAYAFMQAAGMVNDHMKDCYLYNVSDV